MDDNKAMIWVVGIICAVALIAVLIKHSENKDVIRNERHDTCASQAYSQDIPKGDAYENYIKDCMN